MSILLMISHIEFSLFLITNEQYQQLESFDTIKEIVKIGIIISFLRPPQATGLVLYTRIQKKK